jgi:phosphoribosylglycinamide formyltransferase-1
MQKSIGNKVNCAVFISGTGTNLKKKKKKEKKKFFPIKVSLVISNKSDAFGLNYAKKK